MLARALMAGPPRPARGGLAVVFIGLLLPSLLLAQDEPKPPKVAVGLAPLDRGISVWLLRQESMWGLELDGIEKTWDRPDPIVCEFFEDNERCEYDEYVFSIYGSLTAKRIFSPGKFSKLTYLSFYVEHYHRDWYEALFSESALGLEGGLGILWKPIEQMSLSLRQGVAVGFYENAHAQEQPGHDIERFGIELVQPRLLVLVYF